MRRVIILATTVAALLLAACGGGAADKDGSTDGTAEAKRVAYLTCLRKAGVTVREQQTGAERSVEIQVPRGISKGRMAEVERDCARKTGGGPREGRQLTRAEQARFLDRALEFARCMRAHGIAMSDPRPDGRGITMRIGGAGGKGESPALRRAQEACKAFNPKKGLK